MISRVIIVNQWIQTEFTIWCLTACAQSHLPQYYNVIYTLITHFFLKPTDNGGGGGGNETTTTTATTMSEKRNNKYSHSSFMILLLLLSVIISMLPMMWIVASSLRYCCSSIHFYNIVWCAKNQYNHHNNNNNSKYILMPQTGWIWEWIAFCTNAPRLFCRSFILRLPKHLWEVMCSKAAGDLDECII